MYLDASCSMKVMFETVGPFTSVSTLVGGGCYDRCARRPAQNSRIAIGQIDYSVESASDGNSDYGALSGVITRRAVRVTRHQGNSVCHPSLVLTTSWSPIEAGDPSTLGRPVASSDE